MSKVRASVAIYGFFEVEVDVPEGVDADVTGAMARELAATLPIKMEVEGALPEGVRVVCLEEDDERGFNDWGEA